MIFSSCINFFLNGIYIIYNKKGKIQTYIKLSKKVLQSKHYYYYYYCYYYFVEKFKAQANFINFFLKEN